MSEQLPVPSKETAAQSSGRDSQRVIMLSALVYVVLMLGGLGLMYSRNSDLATLGSYFLPPKAWPRSLELAFLATGIIVISSFLLESYSRQYRLIKRMMLAIFGPLSVPTLLFLAVLSGIAEELLFRGGIQPYLGLVPAAILFGLVHLGPVGTFSIWTFWAMGAGFIFGAIYEAQQNLFAVILAHIMVNIIGFLTLKAQFRREKKIAAERRI
jgi:membrane protease YdiL (CAAX protease family)